MFNAEKLLGRILKETLGGGSSRSKGGGMLDSLTSGQGLMTAIGLGVGAFEILKQQKAKSGTSPSVSAPPAIPGTSQTAGAAPPPLPGTPAQAPPPLPGDSAADKEAKVDTEEIALRMIQVMIAAAHADGMLDASEEKVILERLRGAELSSEENMYLIQELHQPKTVSELTAGIDDPSIGKTMYMLAVATIDIDTKAERIWLDSLGDQLGITPETRSFIEEV